MENRTIQSLIDENPVFETLFLPLYCKAQETHHPRPIIRDPSACELLERIAYDFSYFAKNREAQYHIALRTKILDEQTLKYCEAAQTPLVINLGAGLDTRQSRLGLEHIPWYDLDLEPVIQLRKTLMCCDNHARYIAKSVFDLSWIQDIAEPSDAPLIIAEGLLMYCTRTDVARLVGKLFSTFPTCIVLFEAFHTMLVNRGAKSRQRRTARYTWGINSLSDITDLHNNIAIRDEWSLFRYETHRQRLITRLLSKINPNMKELIRIVEIDFTG